MTTNELISIVANTVSDGGHVIVVREEHEQFMNDVAQDLWARAKVAHVVREYDLPATLSYFDLPADDIVEFVSLQVRYKSPAVNVPEQPILDTTIAYAPQQEKPPKQNIDQGQGVYRNVGDVVYKQSLTPELRAGRYRIHSPLPFLSSTVLTAHCVIHSPRYQWLLRTAQVDPTAGPDPNLYTDDERIWEPFRNLFIEGCTWRAARRIFNHTHDQARGTMARNAMDLYYQRYLPEAQHFIHSMKDSTAGLHVQPFRWLE